MAAIDFVLRGMRSCPMNRWLLVAVAIDRGASGYGWKIQKELNCWQIDLLHSLKRQGKYA